MALVKIQLLMYHEKSTIMGYVMLKFSLLLALFLSSASVIVGAEELQYAVKFDGFCNVKNFKIDGGVAHGSELGCARAGQSVIGAAMADESIIFSTIGGNGKVCMHNYSLVDLKATISCTNGQDPARTRVVPFVFGRADAFPVEPGEYIPLPDVEDF